MTDEEACRALGVEPGAEAKQVQAAYRRKALELHPDRAASPEQAERNYTRFLEVRDAYEHLRRAGFPARPVLPEPEEVIPVEEIFSQEWLAGRSFAPKGPPEQVPLLQKLGLDFRVSNETLIAWVVMLPASLMLLAWFVKFLVAMIRGPEAPLDE